MGTRRQSKKKGRPRGAAGNKARAVKTAPTDLAEETGLPEAVPVVAEPVVEAPPEVPVVVAAPAPARRLSLPVIGASAAHPPHEEAPDEEDVRDLVSFAQSPTSIDAFGRDPAFERRAEKALEFFYRRYFRVEVRNIDNVPDKGAVLLVANHSGSLPLDGAMLKLALSLDHPAHRRLRPLAENFVYHFPFVGVLLNRFGAVRACQENAEALLRDGEAVAVFPEGVKGLGKPFRKRYQLQRFGRGGFIRLALRTRTPIVPVAIVGAEETTPVIARLVRPGRTLGLPYLPVTPTFPFLGPLGLMPLPTKWTIEFGEPVRLNADETADDLTIARLTEDIRGDIQARLDKLLSQRTGWFL